VGDRRAAIVEAMPGLPLEALPFESPKLTATAIVAPGEDFGRRRGKAVERSRTKLIEHQPPTAEPVPDRRFPRD
jgi:hypothetical protein